MEDRQHYTQYLGSGNTVDLHLCLDGGVTAPYIGILATRPVPRSRLEADVATKPPTAELVTRITGCLLRTCKDRHVPRKCGKLISQACQARPGPCPRG